MDSMPALFPTYNMTMANPYLPRIHGSKKPGPGRLKQSHGHESQPEYQQPHQHQHQHRSLKNEMMSDITGSRHYTPNQHSHMSMHQDQHHQNQRPLFGYNSDYDPQQKPNPHRELKVSKRREKSLEREREAEAKKMKKNKSMKKKSKSFDEGLDPLPLLTLPRVELWCRDPQCQYTKYQNHSHCNTSSSSSSGRNSIATNTSSSNGKGSGYPGKISRSRLSNNTASTTISGSSHGSGAGITLPLPLSSDTTTTTLTLESTSSGNSTSNSGFNSGSGSGSASGADGESGGDVGRSFFGFGGRQKHSGIGGHNNANKSSKQISQGQGYESSFEGSRRSILHAYTQYPGHNLGHGLGPDNDSPSSFDSAIQSEMGNNTNDERGTYGNGAVLGSGPPSGARPAPGVGPKPKPKPKIGAGPGAGPGSSSGSGITVTRSSRAANALANSLAIQVMDGQTKFSSPPSTGMSRGGSVHHQYPKSHPHANQTQSQLCSPYCCNHQCQQSQCQQNLNQLQLPLDHPSPVSRDEAGGGEGNNKLEGINSFWHLNNMNGFQSTLKRDASFHSYGGFTLNGHPGYNKNPNKMGRFCSSHKIALVVSTFSLFVTIGLVITLLFMKNKGMMEAMK